MRYYLYLPLAIIFKLFAKVLSPVLPLFAVVEWGPGAAEDSREYAPRLPSWLWWFMMDDHSLWGGEEWRTKIHPGTYKSWLGMSLWLFRNSAVNFGRYPLSLSPDDPRIWQKRRRYNFKRFAIETNFGWHLDHVGRYSGTCGYVFSVKFKRIK